MLEVTDATFDAEVANSKLPVVIEFWANWCGPCKTLAPLIEEIANEFEGKAKFVKIDVDTAAIAREFDVRGVPTLAIVKSGVLIDMLVGLHQRPKMSVWLMTNL